ncbi:MAG: hypothetical protein KDB00_29280 [Planctomycetales bacterium]|nr:hypothetical protein [Planctomycetales bacterium]
MIVALAVLISVESGCWGEDRAERLLKVVLNNDSVFVGYTLKSDESEIEFFDLKSDHAVSFQRDMVRSADAVSFDQAVKVAGFPAMFSWKIAELANDVKKIGKVAKVTPQVVYINLGRAQGMRKGTKTTVFRNLGDIVDPDTGEVLATERPKIAELTVVEVDQLYSKARLLGDLEVNLQIGDEVETDNRVVVAVCPIAFEDGTTSKDNSAFEEDLITSLVNRKITVVERSNLHDVLGELLIQNTVLFDRDAAKKVGELTGASHVVVGKVIPASKNLGNAFVRLVEVETGRIVVASTTSISTSGSSSGPNRQVPLGVSRIARLGGTGMSRQLPRFLTTRSQYQMTRSGAIRIQGAHDFTIKSQGAIQTKDAGFLAKDFVFEVVVSFDQEDSPANVGMGPGYADAHYNGLADSVYLQLVNPSKTAAISGGVVYFTRFKASRQEIGQLPNPGPHLVRISKTGSTVTFHVDSGNDGPTDDDFETTVQDIGQTGPFFNSKNSPLFFGGGGEFSNVKLKL